MYIELERKETFFNLLKDINIHPPVCHIYKERKEWRDKTKWKERKQRGRQEGREARRNTGDDSWTVLQLSLQSSVNPI